MIYKNQEGKIVSKKEYNVDFVFVYETKARELQGISLLGYELICRGYTVAYVNTWKELHRNPKKISAKVAVIHAGYNTKVISFDLGFIDKFCEIFNLQWEQLLNPQCLWDNSHFILSGDAAKIYHASWGEKNAQHLVERCNIPADKPKVVGHLGLDFVRKQFSGFYYDKNYILEKYNLDPTKRLALFTGSFPAQVRTGVWTTRTPEYVEAAVKSRDCIIEWMKRYHEYDENTQFVYRPHPIEKLTDEYVKMIEEGGFIRVISDYSVQQWIVIADVILNWRSTSIADFYAADKPNMILRPVEIPEYSEFFMLQEAEKITDFETFKERMNGEVGYPISKEKFHEYYYIDDNEPTYKKIVEELEKLYKLCEPGKLHELYKEKNKGENEYIRDIKNSFGFFLTSLKILLHIKTKDDYQEAYYQKGMAQRNGTNDKEIIEIMNRIAKVIDNNNKE